VDSPEELSLPVPFAVVHHGGIKKYCTAKGECAAIARSYQNYHIDGRGWNDIGYNFLVGEDGNVYEGRGWEAVGAHAPTYNTRSIGVCILGDFTGTRTFIILLRSSHRFASLTATLFVSLLACGGGIEYLHRCPARRKSRQKGTPVPGGITGPHCSWGI
jgi:hypothetical protein